MSKPTVKNRLADAFANLGLGDSRKKLDALNKPHRVLSGKERRVGVGKSTIVEKTIDKNTIPETTIDDISIAKKTMVAPTIAKSPSPAPRPQSSGKAAGPAKPKTTIVEKTTVKSTRPKPSSFWTGDSIWELVDQAFPSLKPNSIVLYMYLLRESYGQDRGETDFISLNTLSKRSGINRKSVPAAMASLRSCGRVMPIETSGKLGSRYSVFGLGSGE